MDYLEYKINVRDQHADPEILIAFLSEAGYEGFVESGNFLVAYLPANLKDEELLREILEQSGTNDYSVELLPDKNWNEVWESDFHPIEIDDQVKIRASFHPYDPAFRHDILIDPKMSFGTGHHETTRLMIKAMLATEFNEKNVLDMGCGTGILAILASKLGAAEILAVDIDEWAYSNARDNIQRNNCKGIVVRQGDIALVNDFSFDVLLANINRNVLLQDMDHYFSMLTAGGELILSGIMIQDESTIFERATNSGFSFEKVEQEGKWKMMRFIKP